MSSLRIRNHHRGDPSRSRGLAHMNERFKPVVVENVVGNLRRNANSNINVLEIGIGEGRLLLELRRLFSDINLFGINRYPDALMNCKDSFIECAKYYNIFSDKESGQILLPKVDFYDAENLKFDDGFMDLIISQTAIQYIRRKDRLLEEIWRVLKVGGVSILHFDTRMNKTSDIMLSDTPRLIVYRDEQKISLKEIVKDMYRKGFDITYRENEQFGTLSQIIITMNKNKKDLLDLNWCFDEVSSFNLDVLNVELERWNHYWGYRSVYNIH